MAPLCVYSPSMTSRSNLHSLESKDDHSGLQFEANKIFSIITPLFLLHLISGDDCRIVQDLRGSCGSWVLVGTKSSRLRCHTTVRLLASASSQGLGLHGSRILRSQGKGVGTRKGSGLCVLSPSPDKTQGSWPKVLGAPNSEGCYYWWSDCAADYLRPCILCK